MLSKIMNDELNEQLKNELYSGHYYLSMAAFCASINMNGFANFFIVQEQEERFHAMKFFNYINEKNGTVIIIALDQPKTDFKSLEEVFELALKHEQLVTGLIYKLMDLAIEEKDHSTQSFLKWFIDEQVEEEANMQGILDKIRLVGERGQGIFMLDQELAQRVFTPPVE